MKLLIVTQAVDTNHPILGFFHRWLEEFSKHCTELTILGQQVGSHALPPRVKVCSLGKEQGASRLCQVLRAWKLSWQQRHAYDAVLVHMTPVWVILCWPVWMLCGKPIYLWYEVRRGGTILRIAEFLVRTIFSATPQGMPWASSKQLVLGHGIDTAFFSPDGSTPKPLVVTVGRVTPVKHFPAIIDAAAQLSNRPHLRIIGGPMTESDQVELQRVHARIAENLMEGRVTIGFASQEEIRDTLRTARLFLHAASGGLDKAILEAMSCGVPVLTTSVAARAVLPEACWSEVATFNAKAEKLWSLPDAERVVITHALRDTIEKHHSLPKLISRMCSVIAQQ